MARPIDGGWGVSDRTRLLTIASSAVLSIFRRTTCTSLGTFRRWRPAELEASTGITDFASENDGRERRTDDVGRQDYPIALKRR